MQFKKQTCRSLLLGLFCLLAPGLVGAQSVEKKALSHEDYDLWKSISGTTLTNDGDWLAYVISAREADGTLTVRSTDPGTRSMTVQRATGPRFTADSRFLVFTLEPAQEVVDSLEEADTKREDMPRDSLGIVDLDQAFGSGGSINTEFFRVPRVTSWKMPADEGTFVAYLLDPEEDEEAADEAEEETPEEPAEEAEEDEKPDRDKDEGNPLILRDLESGQETRFEDVTAYFFTDDGEWLVYSASNEDGTADGVYAVETSSGEASTVLAGEGAYQDITLDDEGKQIAFLTNRDAWDTDAEEPAMTLFHSRLGQGEAQPVATEGTPGIPQGWWVPDYTSLSFSDEGTRLFFGTAPKPPEEEEDETPDDEKVVVDIWNWKDPVIQPMQKVQADRRREQTFLAYASTDDHSVVQLATENMPVVQVGQGRDGPMAVGATDQYTKYGWYVSHEGSAPRDVFLVDVATGEAEMLMEKAWAMPSFSTGGNYLSWWDGHAKHYMVMDLDTRETRNVSEALPFPVHNELDDQPDEPRPYGSSGWTEDDEAYLIYDRFDLWAVDPTGQDAPRNLTNGYGRENEIRFRYMDLDAGSGPNEGVDLSEPALLEARGLFTKQAGFYRTRLDRNQDPQRLIMDDFSFGRPTKADDADVMVLTRQSFREFPDLWLSGPDFDDMVKVTDANPQQDEYVWGDAEIIEWVSNDGIPLQGILIKPDGFDPNKKYPMMVYFYERSSDGIHRYRSPGPGTSVNPSFYVSRGYVFFNPDIPYEIGHPGESAIDAVVPGVLKIVDQGYVDKDRIGAQGHSWGGYQLAYMITRTNIFAAVEGGAPVSNMTSAYGGIRWDSGRNRQFQYEHTQSRIGGTLWEETMRYINNSPLFEADKVQTPFLMIHNDEDGAVPWYQGIEFYMALRRLQKPVWMLNYNGERHGLRRRPNLEDWTIRMQQFFDHYLKDAPAPVWMEVGVPAVMKGKEFGLELMDKGGH